MEWYLSIAESELRKIILAPYPPTTPTTKSITVEADPALFEFNINAANIWAIVKSMPPMNIVFLTPNLS